MDKEVTTTQVMEAVTVVRKTVEDMGKGLVTKEALTEIEAKTQKVIDQFEDQNQKAVVALKETEKKELEQKERIDELELLVSKQAEAPAGAEDYKKGEQYKALTLYMKHGKQGMMSHEDEDVREAKTLLDNDLREMKTLRTDIDTQGGYLVPEEMDNVIIKAITEISAMRKFARVRTVGKKTLEIPKRGTLLQATWEGEAAAGEQDNSEYKSETLTANRLTVQVPITLDMLMDSAFDMESEITSDVGERFAQKEGLAFISGDANKKPEGVIVNTEVIANAYTGAASGVIGFDDLIKITGELKTGYNPMWAMNRRTLATIRSLKDGNGQYAWQPGMEIGGSQPATLLGDPYALMPDMPDIAVGALPVLYGDFLRGYTIIDRTGVEMVRDEITGALNAIIKFTFRKYVHGQVVLSEAFVPLKIKA